MLATVFNNSIMQAKPRSMLLYHMNMDKNSAEINVEISRVSSAGARDDVKSDVTILNKIIEHASQLISDLVITIYTLISSYFKIKCYPACDFCSSQGNSVSYLQKHISFIHSSFLAIRSFRQTKRLRTTCGSPW